MVTSQIHVFKHSNLCGLFARDLVSFRSPPCIWGQLASMLRAEQADKVIAACVRIRSGWKLRAWRVGFMGNSVHVVHLVHPTLSIPSGDGLWLWLWYNAHGSHGSHGDICRMVYGLWCLANVQIVFLVAPGKKSIRYLGQPLLGLNLTSYLHIYPFIPQSLEQPWVLEPMAEVGDEDLRIPAKCDDGAPWVLGNDMSSWTDFLDGRPPRRMMENEKDRDYSAEIIEEQQRYGNLTRGNVWHVLEGNWGSRWGNRPNGRQCSAVSKTTLLRSQSAVFQQAMTQLHLRRRHSAGALPCAWWLIGERFSTNETGNPNGATPVVTRTLWFPRKMGKRHPQHPWQVHPQTL